MATRTKKCENEGSPFKNLRIRSNVCSKIGGAVGRADFAFAGFTQPGKYFSSIVGFDDVMLLE